jgi:adenosylcobyric acid synthase
MHGLFSNPSAVNAILSYIAIQKQLEFTPIPQDSPDPYDELAALFEEYVNMDAISALVTEQ